MKALIVALLIALGWTGANAAPKAQLATAYFAGGCFWCMEHDMAIPGVVEVVSGYAGGEMKNPTYENHGNHLEAVKVVYDPAKVSYGTLLTRFWLVIDPTDPSGQFCDRGHAYQTAVWVRTKAERAAAETSRDIAARRLKTGEVVTPILRFTSFWPAEGYHQDFAENNLLRYNLYRQGCGRDARLRALWGRSVVAD